MYECIRGKVNFAFNAVYDRLTAGAAYELVADAKLSRARLLYYPESLVEKHDVLGGRVFFVPPSKQED
jgi:hypothetical protein